MGHDDDRLYLLFSPALTAVETSPGARNAWSPVAPAPIHELRTEVATANSARRAL